MTLQYTEQPSRLAPWSARFALIGLQLLLLGVLLHRFASLGTMVAINLLLAAYLAAGLAMLIAGLSLQHIWQTGATGAGRASFAVILALAMFAWPALYLPRAVALPAINDVSTDAADPPPFSAIAPLRGQGSNPTVYPGARFADLQARGYPDIQPLTAPRPAGEAFEIARQVVKSFGWDVIAERPPGLASDAGTIEAVDRSLIMGYPDDVVLRVSASASGARIDVRSASRYGTHDFGRNAERVRTVLKAMRLSLETGLVSEAVAAVPEVNAKQKKSSEGSGTPRKKRVRVQSGAQGGQALTAQQRRKANRRYLDTLGGQSTR